MAALAAMMAAGPAWAQTAPDLDLALEDQAEETIHHIAATVDSDGAAAIAGINAFSLDLYRATLVADDNHFLSPASVSVAVGMAYRGARGTTASELEKVMHFGKAPREYLRANGQVLDTMNFGGPRRELRTANAIWLQDGTAFVPDFEQDMANFAKAGIQRVDYRRDPEAARAKVNGWVAERTRDKIKDLLTQDDVTKDTRAILVNAIYWKGNWASVFDKALTKREDFTALQGSKAAIPLMTQGEEFQVLERNGVKAILLPYVGGEMDMAVFLPNSAKGLPKFEQGLTADGLSKWLKDLSDAPSRMTILTLPKLRLDNRTDLKETLSAMGAPTAFSDDADFSAMAVYPQPGETPAAIGLKISKVIHQTYLDVDEVGSEAAAATAVMNIMVTSGRRGPPPPPPFIFRADKPFLFLLRDRRTGLILFMGRYVKPDDKAIASQE